MAGGRPIKRGLDYFHIDTSIGDKVKYLTKKCRMDGYGIFVFLLGRIYKNEGYYCKWDEMAQVLFCDSGIEYARLKEIVECCFEVGLFDREMYAEHKILTSAEIQKRYMGIIHGCKRKGIKIDEKFKLISSEETPVSSEETGVNSEKSKKKSHLMPQNQQ